MFGTAAHAGVTVRYQHTDSLGSVIMETNASGQMIGSRHQYQPFGQGLNGQKTGLGYTGHLEDTDLGLTYMQQRYYDPVIGRFYSNDPVGFTASNPMMFNRYAYANNNPYKYVDPDGRNSRRREEAAAMLGTTIAEAAGLISPKTAAGMRAGITDGKLKADDAATSKKETSRSARKEVMRQQKIPTSQQPTSQSQNDSGREYKYDVPKAGGATETKSVQQQTMDSSHPGQNHWEAGSVKTDPVTGEIRMNDYGRPKLTNDKSKVDYD
jgi:RHS repeat-associated protein